jgi:hypothetical protein
MAFSVMPDLRSLPRQFVGRGHPEGLKNNWIPAFAGMTYFIVMAIKDDAVVISQYLPQNAQRAQR